MDSLEVKDFANRRLTLLESKFLLHLALNHANEAGTTEDKASSNRDLYHSVKVDTHIHMAAGMTARELLTFMLDIMRNSPDDIVGKQQDGQILTLDQMFKQCNITENLTVDQLSVAADHTLFERFDNFNNRYNPMENSDLRTLLLKTDNYMNGRYFAEIINRKFAQYTKDRFTFAENRLSIYGNDADEWLRLAQWFDTHGMASKHNKWIIQLPRLYKVFRAQQVIGSFGQYLYNIFKPLWDVSMSPSKYPVLHNFLNHVSGFDSVDNEATIDLPFLLIPPYEWTMPDNPPYNYYMYHLYANTRTLNEFRSSRGFSTFSFRPHGGESGTDEHLIGCFLTADAISHGINLRSNPSLQYLYYVCQIGLAVAPLSNNGLFLYFLKNPFPEFFRRGLFVSLSTDDPLMFHQTQEPLIEEYSIAAKVWGFSPNDMCEIARNSVLQSGFDSDWKMESIGNHYYMSSSLGNDPIKTHLSDIRVAFRFETYHTEVAYLESVAKCEIPRSKHTTEEEQEIMESQQFDKPEEVLLSTHDQEMEVVQRDVEAKKEQIRLTQMQLESLRRQNKNLVENLSDIGAKLAQLNEQAPVQEQQPLVYTSEKRRTARGALALPWMPRAPIHNRSVKTVMRSATRPLPSPPDSASGE